MGISFQRCIQLFKTHHNGDFQLFNLTKHRLLIAFAYYFWSTYLCITILFNIKIYTHSPRIPLGIWCQMKKFYTNASWIIFHPSNHYDYSISNWVFIYDLYTILHMMTSSNGNIFLVTGSLWKGNSMVTGEFLSQRPVTRSFDVFFGLCLNKRLSKQSWCWWFETPSHPLWRHRNSCSGLMAVNPQLNVDGWL